MPTTLRYITCPCCSHTMTASALNGRPAGKFEVDIRLCQGRKGFPHVATEVLSRDETDLVRSRLLSAVQAALHEAVLTREDLMALLGVPSSVNPAQIPLPVTDLVRPMVSESVQPNVSESIRARVREE